MVRKALIIHLSVVFLFAAGCARREHTPPVPPEAPLVAPPKPAPSPSATPAPIHPKAPSPKRNSSQPPIRTASSPAVPKSTAPNPFSALPSLVTGNATWVNDRTLHVTQGPPKPISLFRQAIVLAAVRAASAKSPAAPKVEFRHGLLTLSFDRGTPAQVADAINRALAVPEATSIRASLPQ